MYIFQSKSKACPLAKYTVVYIFPFHSKRHPVQNIQIFMKIQRLPPRNIYAFPLKRFGHPVQNLLILMKFKSASLLQNIRISLNSKGHICKIYIFAKHKYVP